ncbi:hypothetical protein LTS10_007605 [Elasticomyces elasticus]|nr:hypothetical protein LTS10_007605 [Elasticomyces elasticus]
MASRRFTGASPSEDLELLMSHGSRPEPGRPSPTLKHSSSYHAVSDQLSSSEPADSAIASEGPEIVEDSAARTRHPDGGPKSRIRRFRQENSGWRMGVLLGLCISTSVLLGNLALVFVGFRYNGYQNGIGVLAQGRSTSVARLSTAYHALINILSTLLLTSSNYCMQVLCSPSREDIDYAHGEGSYVNIVTIGHQYTAYFVADPGRENESYFNAAGNTSWPPYLPTTNLSDLSTQQLLTIYATEYIPDHGDVYILYDAVAFGVIISDEDGQQLTLTLNNTLTAMPPSSWVAIRMDQRLQVPAFSLPSDLSVLSNVDRTLPFFDEGDLQNFKASNWTGINGTLKAGTPPIHISQILSVPLQDGSKVQLILSYMLVVIFCNALKVLVIWRLWRQPHVEYFTTIGDAVQSFLRCPDRSTIGLCMETYDDLTYLMEMQHRRRTAHMVITHQPNGGGFFVQFSPTQQDWWVIIYGRCVDGVAGTQTRRSRLKRVCKLKERELVAWKHRSTMNYATAFAKGDDDDWWWRMKGTML